MIKVILLGNAQDAGAPQAGCRCANCSTARAQAKPKWVSALGLIDTEAGAYFLIDATPDFREQFHLLQMAAGGGRFSRQAGFGGILITHAHIGHYTGLIHLGYEAMAAREVPLFGSSRLLNFLRANAPWQQLVEQNNISLREFTPDDWIQLTPGLAVQPIQVPHRAEWSDTVGFVARGSDGMRSLLYLPDIDAWDGWDRPVREVVASVSVALLDGSFFDPAELPGRDISKIGHPLVTDTVARLRGLTTDVRFIHLNHSNPLHQPGRERTWLQAQGSFSVGAAGDSWDL